MRRLLLLFSVLVIGACAQQQPPPPSPPPPPPPPPAPAPEQPHAFKIYFNSGSSALTPEARQIVDAAAASFKAGPPAPIQVVGHTDTAGSAALNQRLSQRRADTVARALGQAGVPRDQITVSAAGEGTPAGSPAESRRVEITESAGGPASSSAPPPPGPPGSGAPPPPGS